MTRPRARRLGAVTDTLAGLTLAQASYLLLLAVAGLRRDRLPAPDTGEPPRLVVLVPAHDEARTITSAVASLLGCDYPPERRDVVVIADNCRDRTAELAQTAGATVWERRDEARPGKGEALAWALDRLRGDRAERPIVVMMDADCVAERSMLRTLAQTIAAGADAAQGAYLGSNPTASTSAALRWAGYALMNATRPRGKDRLGLSCGLYGSGMAFAAETLGAVPWGAFSVTEDKEQHLLLLEAGRRVRFAPGALVSSPMPTEQARAETQQVRWETGNASLARRWIPRLLARGLRERDGELLHAAWELTVPPLSLLAGAQAGLGLVALASRSRRLAWIVAATLSALTGFVMIGLRAADAPASVIRALGSAPRLIVRRVAQYASLARGGGHTEWHRTERD